MTLRAAASGPTRSPAAIGGLTTWGKWTFPTATPQATASSKIRGIAVGSAQSTGPPATWMTWPETNPASGLTSPGTVRHDLSVTSSPAGGRPEGEHDAERGGAVEQGFGASRDVGVSGGQCGGDIRQAAGAPQLRDEGTQGRDAVTGFA